MSDVQIIYKQVMMEVCEAKIAKLTVKCNVSKGDMVVVMVTVKYISIYFGWC